MSLIIIRGAAGSGKSTLAENLRKHLPKKTAIIHTSLFFWEIVDGGDTQISLENTYKIIDNYLKNKYKVVLEGTLAQKTKKGRYWVDKLESLAKKHNKKAHRFFLTADLKELREREKKRKKITQKRLTEFYKKTHATYSKRDILIDTTHKSPNKLVTEIIEILRK